MPEKETHVMIIVDQHYLRLSFFLDFLESSLSMTLDLIGEDTDKKCTIFHAIMKGFILELQTTFIL